MTFKSQAKLCLEVCLDSIESAIISEKNGASRVELCDNLIEGGTTPSYGTIKVCKKSIKIPIMVMIRPRGGDFCYSDLEFQGMKEDVIAAKELGVDGVVFGLLLSDGNVDVSRTKELVQLAKPMMVTFHRAFDMSRDPFKAMEDLISIGGIERILTSGQEAGVLEGLPLIIQLIDCAKGRIQIMPGCGITSRNLSRILQEAATKLPHISVPIPEVHLALPEDVESSMKYRNGSVFMGVAITTPEYSIKRTSGSAVKAIIDLL